MLWRRREGKQLAALIGALLIGLGLSYFVAMTEDTRYEMTETIRERWQSDYDILVRPWSGRPGAVSTIERSLDLLEANHLSGIPGGISVADWRAIQEIPGVEVAAPLAVCGTVDGTVPFDTPYTPQEEGVYCVQSTFTYLGDLLPITGPVIRHYFAVGEGLREVMGSGACSGWSDIAGYAPLSYRQPVRLPLAAIDPVAEARLVGLDRAVSGRRLSSEFTPSFYQGPRDRQQCLELPVLVAAAPNTRQQVSIDVYRLPLSADRDTAATIRQGGRDWLETLPREPLGHFELDEVDFHQGLLAAADERDRGWSVSLRQPPGFLNYRRPGPEGELVIEPVGGSQDPKFGRRTTYRSRRELSLMPGPWVDEYDVPRLYCRVVGLYNVDRLDIGRDPLTELPLETYRPAEALLVRDPDGTPRPEPVKLTPTGFDLGLLTQPPLMLTNLDAARVLLGEHCISAVRVRVAGVEDMSEASRRRVEWVAKEIQARTGLCVDVTVGSSPTRREVFVAGRPKTETQAGISPLGYIELPFVQKNVHLTIVGELNRGNLAILGAVLLVAVLYAFTHAATDVYSRRRDMATQRALGWRSGHVLRQVVVSSLVFGGLAAAAGVGLSFFLADWGGLYVPWARLLLIAGVALFVYLVGSLAPGMAAARVSPLPAMTQGEAGGRMLWTPRGGRAYAGRTGASVWGLAAGGFLARWRRHLLTLACLGVATALLAAFVLVTVRLRGVLCSTFLGQFLIIEVGPRHLLTAVLCLGLAGLAVAELMSLNVSERRGELELLAALGWRPTTLRLLIAAEGALAGLAGGCLGVGLAVYALAAYYGAAAIGLIPPALAVLPVLVLTGFLGALLPALAVGGRL